MNEHYEAIKSKTVCPECGNKDLAFGYMYEPGGAVKVKKQVLGMNTYSGFGDLLLIICQKCGCVAKSFVFAHNKK